LCPLFPQGTFLRSHGFHPSENLAAAAAAAAASTAASGP